MDRFVAIKLSTDATFTYIDTTTNCFNALKTLSHFKKVQPMGNADKKISQWIKMKKTKILLDHLKDKMESPVIYDIASDVNELYYGTYMTATAYHHFLMWLDVEYAIDATIAIDEFNRIQNIVQLTQLNADAATAANEAYVQACIAIGAVSHLTKIEINDEATLSIANIALNAASAAEEACDVAMTNAIRVNAIVAKSVINLE